MFHIDNVWQVFRTFVGLLQQEQQLVAVGSGNGQSFLVARWRPPLRVVCTVADAAGSATAAPANLVIKN